MSKNGIAWLSTKEDKQKAKLAIAEAKRQGKTITEGGGTYSISGSIDPTKPGYRTNNLLDLTELPTVYSGNNVSDNPNTGGLLPARPWKPQP